MVAPFDANPICIMWARHIIPRQVISDRIFNSWCFIGGRDWVIIKQVFFVEKHAFACLPTIATTVAKLGAADTGWGGARKAKHLSVILSFN